SRLGFHRPLAWRDKWFRAWRDVQPVASGQQSLLSLYIEPFAVAPSHVVRHLAHVERRHAERSQPRTAEHERRFEGFADFEVHARLAQLDRMPAIIGAHEQATGWKMLAHQFNDTVGHVRLVDA